jgi:hypothetical protein
MNLLREYIIELLKGSDEILSENWRKYLKDNNLDELPLGATTGPLAEPSREVYKFKSPEERWEYTKWKHPKAKRHKMGFTWDDIFGDDDTEEEGHTAAMRESLISERGDTDYKEQMVTDIAADVQIVNDAIESLHPAHAIPNSEHVEGSIGEALDLISLKKKYGRSRNEHAAQQLLDMWRTAMGAGGGKKGAAVGFLLAAGGAALADHIFLGGALTYLGLGGAGLNTIYEVMAGNAADDDLKKYIKWDPEILGWMDDKKEDELEDEWIDLLFEHISNNPQSDLTDFISINDFANEKLGRPIKGEKIRIRTDELHEYIRELLTEDAMGFVHDLAAASEEFGLPDIEKGEDAKLPFFGGNPGSGGGKAIKRSFNANADHQWLSTLDTVHWVEDAYSLEGLVGKSKDELSTTMTLPGDNLKGLPGMKIGLWVKGRITLAANNHDELYSGKHGTYTALARDFPDTSAGKKQIQQAKSSGINKRPMVSKDYSRYGNLKRGTEFGEKRAKNIPYVLDQSTWNPTDVNEALVDNWNPVGIVVGKWLEPIKLSIQSLSDEKFKDSAGVNAPGVIGKIFKLAAEFGVPIYDRDRKELWSPE